MLDLSDRTVLACANCDETIEGPARFCPHCGSELPVEDEHPTVVLDADESEDAAEPEAAEPDAVELEAVEPDAVEPEAAEPAPARDPKRRRIALACGAATLVLGGIGFGVYEYQQRAAYKAEIAAILTASETALAAAVADLADAKRTTGIRAVAVDASAASEPLDDVIPVLGEQEGQRARSVHAALDSLAALEVLQAGELGQWRDLRPAVASSLDAVAVEDADRAVASADRVVKRGQAKLKQWRKDLAAAKAAKRSDLVAFDSYVAAMESHIRTYKSMRDDTASEIQAMRDDASNTYYYAPTRALFSSAMDDRIGVRDSMNSLRVPAGMADRHATLVGVVSDGISGMAALLGALDDNQDCYEECFLFSQPLWYDFQATSDDVSARYATAQSTWRAGLPGARQAIESQPLPKPPVV